MNYSFSNEGEDVALHKLFGSKKNGFYVDVGANHPIKFSNTMWFYNHGWSGINIDALPGSKKIFDKYRKRDINIESGVGLDSKKLEYYTFDLSALNTFDTEVVETRIKQGFAVREIKEIEVIPLSLILDKYIPKGQVIDFLDVDVEGMDYQVLQSNNWDKYRPNYVLAESIGGDTCREVISGDISAFLCKQGYELYMKFFGTAIYKADN